MDWIAACLELVGLILVGNRNRYGFVLGLACNIVWVLYVLHQGVTFGLIPVSIAMAGVNIRNFRLWGKEERPHG